MKHRRSVLWLSLALSVGLVGWPTLAGAGHEDKHHKHDKHCKHSKYRATHVTYPAKLARSKPRGGPPPWAPAHGYRHKHGKKVYVAPYGIDRGICSRDLIGAAVGGTAGGLLASSIAKGSDRPAAIVGGVLLGALLGGALADAMDPLDHGCLGQVLEHAPSSGAVRWENPDRDRRYEVTPTRTYQEGSGRYCREYQTTVTIGGRRESAYGTACRQPDGSWQRV
jgi:surface antigen